MIGAIPDEIMQRASELSLNMNAEPFYKHANMIASAIMAERERCLGLVAEIKTAGPSAWAEWKKANPDTPPNFDKTIAIIIDLVGGLTSDLADSIRSGEQPTGGT